MALTITVAGGFCLLAGMLLLGHIVGSYDLDRVLASGNLVRQHPWYPIVLTLVALGALTKCAQFPFHIWLPNAMAAPPPASASLHSATDRKSGGQGKSVSVRVDIGGSRSCKQKKIDE